jgi:hypothetical protein
MKERFWKKKLAAATEPRVWISGTLPRRVFYSATFFYLSFLAHWFVSRLPEPSIATPAVAQADRPLEHGVFEPLLDRLLGARRGT